MVLVALPDLARGQAIELILEGVADRDGRTVITGPTAGGGVSLDGGAVDALGWRKPRTGRLVRWRNGGGAFVVWTMQATVSHPGPTARIELVADGSADHGMRFALGRQTQWLHAKAGTALPKLGNAILHPAVLSAHPILFQIAVPIRDAQPAGFIEPRMRFQVFMNSDMRLRSPVGVGFKADYGLPAPAQVLPQPQRKGPRDSSRPKGGRK